MSRFAMTALDRESLVRFRHANTGRQEVHEATSADGVWHYKRVDAATGRHWMLTCIPTGRQATYGGLTAARRATANGIAEVELLYGQEVATS